MCGNVRTSDGSCGNAAGSNGVKSSTLIDRFWSKVDRKSDGECWLWTASCNYSDDRGYGQFWLTRSKSIKAHRFAYELAFGPIPPGMMVCHRCDVRRCCNPAHLFVGTMADNAQDAYRKGRIDPRGRHAKLTADIVRHIRHTNRSNALLAREFGVSDGCIDRARRGETWKHVEMPTGRVGGCPYQPFKAA